MLGQVRNSELILIFEACFILFFSILSSLSFAFPFPFHFPLRSLRLKVALLNPATSLGKRCKFPSWDRGGVAAANVCLVNSSCSLYFNAF